jgi:hypothetical protein
MATTTVEFDVGGTIYKASKSLLDRFPNSMLATIASTRWKTEHSGDTKNNLYNNYLSGMHHFLFLYHFVRLQTAPACGSFAAMATVCE